MVNKTYLDLAHAIEALGYDLETAIRYACFIGEKPQFDEESRVIVSDGLNEVARLKFDWDWEDYRPGEQVFSWEEIEDARRNAALQEAHPVDEGKDRYLKSAKSCQKCHAPPQELAWFYFETDTPPEWECGRGGWISVCDKCHWQVQFFMEWMS